MIDLRFVIRDGKRILQWRQWGSVVHPGGHSYEDWTEWTDVPVVEESKRPVSVPKRPDLLSVKGGDVYCYMRSTGVIEIQTGHDCAWLASTSDAREIAQWLVEAADYVDSMNAKKGDG